jgi:hypothetical protein
LKLIYCALFFLRIIPKIYIKVLQKYLCDTVSVLSSRDGVIKANLIHRESILYDLIMAGRGEELANWFKLEL